MEDYVEPTIIMKSLKDLSKFIQHENTNKQNTSQTSANVSKLKLSFSDSFCSNNSADGSVSGISRALSYGEENDSLTEKSYLQKHQESIAGFDVTKKIRGKDKEIIEAKTKIALLESRVDNIQATHKKTCLDYEIEMDSLRKHQLSEKERIDDLQYKLRQMQNKEKETKGELMKTKKTAELKCTEIEKKLSELRANQLKEIITISEEKDKLRELSTQLQHELQEKKSSVIALEGQTEDMENQIKASRVNIRNTAKLELEIEHLNLQVSQQTNKNKELENRLHGLKEQENKIHLLDKSLTKLCFLEKEVAKLKDENSNFRIAEVNVNLMEEKVVGAEKQVELLESRCRMLQDENGTLITLRNFSDEYEAAIKEELNLSCMPPASELKERLGLLRKGDKGVHKTLEVLKASVKSHENSRINQEELVGKLRGELESGRESINKNAQVIRRLQRKIFLVSKERDSLKEIISTYESESTLHPSAIEKEKLTNMETQLDAYKHEISRLEIELEQFPPTDLDISALKSKGGKVTTKVAHLERRIIDLEDLVENLSNEKESLELRIQTQMPVGSFDPATTKVLQLAENPLSQIHGERKNEMERLQSENDTLKCRMKLMEEGDNLNLTQKVGLKVNSDTINSKQYKELEEKANLNELRTKRLIEVFKQKLQDLREVVYHLTGYRVDVSVDNKYKLINIYAECGSDYLIFEKSTSGDLQLMETDYSCTLESRIEEYLQHENSYPAFLSAVTLDLFNKNMAMPHPSDDDEDDLPEEEEDEEEMREEEEERDLDEEDAELEEEEEDDDEEEEDDDDSERPYKRARHDGDDDEDDLICLD